MTTDPAASATLPHRGDVGFITDGGLETTLIFNEGIDLPNFAAFPLLADDDGRAILTRYYSAYQDIAEQHDVGIVLDTATWRANPDWAARLGWSRDELSAVNRTAVEFVRSLAELRPLTSTVTSGLIGPRGDGYAVGATMTADEATRYHLPQARAFADSGADMITTATMTYVDEAVGITSAARAVGLPVAVGLTVETDGRLPSGQTLRAGIEEIDARTDGTAAYFMVNCAHPTHFSPALTDDGEWLERVKAVRANASRMSHAELDDAQSLDRGDVTELAREYVALAALLPDLRLVGGCCGTDHKHVAAISAALHPVG